MTTTAHEDQYAPEPVSGPTCGECANFDECSTCYAELASNTACGEFRRVTLAHLHLREGEG